MNWDAGPKGKAFVYCSSTPSIMPTVMYPKLLSLPVLPKNKSPFFYKAEKSTAELGRLLEESEKLSVLETEFNQSSIFLLWFHFCCYAGGGGESL